VSFRPGGKWLTRGLLAAGLLVAMVLTVAAFCAWRGLGHRATGARLARIQRSPQWKDGRFRNLQPLVNDTWSALAGAFDASPDASPKDPVPVVRVDPARLAAAPDSGLRVTWFGHSSLLLEIDGTRILTDPVWSDRASPVSWIGPHRWYAPPIALGDLPPIDAVVISHNHYDHLDAAKLSAMKGWNTVFVVPLGVGASLEYWGIPEARIVELDWWERTRIHDIEIVCAPARHASGRALFDTDEALWAGYALLGPRHRVYFSGDTGLFPALAEIGARLGPFDLTAIEVGQYDRAWPDWHIGPEQAVRAHAMLRGRALLPIHWGLFQLAYHGWTEPIERAWAAAQLAGVTVLTPRPGESIEPDLAPAADRWWPAIPWKTAAQAPIVSTQVN